MSVYRKAAVVQEVTPKVFNHQYSYCYWGALYYAKLQWNKSNVSFLVDRTKKLLVAITLGLEGWVAWGIKGKYTNS